MKKIYMLVLIFIFTQQLQFSQTTNYSLSFNGSTDYVSLPEGILNNPEAFTIEAWIKPQVVNTNVDPIYCQGSTGFIFFELSGNLGYFKLQLQLDDGSQNGLWIAAVSNQSLSPNVWQHVVAEYNKSAGRISVYLNGKLVGQNQIPTQYYPKSLGSGFPSRIAKYPDMSLPGYSGLIDVIRISNNERYTSDFSPGLDLQPDQNTLALWKFNEGSGNTANDLSTNGFNGQIVGATYNAETSYNSLVLNMPANNSINAPLNFAVSWSFPTQANSYVVQVATDSSFTNMFLEANNVLEKKYFISGLSSGLTYYWRVKANTPWGETPWTNYFKFTTKSNNNNYSLYLDGISNYVQLPGSLMPPNPDQFTLETWVKPYAYTYNPPPPLFYTAQAGEFSLTVGGPNNFAGLAVNTTNLPDGQWYGVGTSPSIVPDNWYHIAVTYDRIGGKMKVFVNGKFMNENSIPNSYLIQRPNSFVSFIGRYFSGNEYFKGLVDNIRLSNNIRYTSDFIPPLDFQNDQNTIGLWRFNEGNGNIVYDESKNGNHGQIFGATYSSETAMNALSLEMPVDNSQSAPLALGLRWSIAGQVINYRLQVSSTADFSSNIVADVTVTQNNYYISNLITGITYYWRVKANTPWGETPWTNAWKFSTRAQTSNFSLAFDGIDDYVALPNNLIQKAPGEFTIEAWVKPFFNIDNPNFNWTDFFYHGSSGEFSFGINQNNLSVYLGVDLNVSGSQQWVVITSTRSLIAGQWSHIAGTFNSSNKTISVFINGKLSGIQQIPSIELWQPGDYQKTRIGLYGDPNNNRTHYKGSADEVRLSNTVRYAGDFIPQIEFENDNNTVGLWKFNEGSGDVVYDESANGYHGKIVGATYSTETVPNIISPNIVVTPTEKNFGNVEVGKKLYQKFFVRNSGLTDMLISNLQISGPNANEFIVEGQTQNITVGANSFYTIYTAFVPNAVSNASQNAVLKIFSNAVNSSEVDINLSGIGINQLPTECVYQFDGNFSKAMVYAADGMNWESNKDTMSRAGQGFFSYDWCKWYNLSRRSVGGEERSVIESYPQCSNKSIVAEYSVYSPQKFSTYYGIRDEDGFTPGGDARFIVQIKDGNNYNTILDDIVGDQTHWRYFEYDLSQYANKNVIVRFITDPNGTQNQHWAVWGEPKVTISGDCYVKNENYESISSFDQPNSLYFTASPWPVARGWRWDVSEETNIVKSGTGAMKIDWKVLNNNQWGGYIRYEHFNPDPNAVYDWSAFNAISFWYYNEKPSSLPGRVSFHLNLYDVSNSPNGNNTYDNTQTEFYYSIENGIFDTAPGWHQVIIPLKIDPAFDQGKGFYFTGWNGRYGNGVLDLDKIKGFNFEIGIIGSGEGDFAEGTIVLDELKLLKIVPVTVRYECNMEIETLSGRFNPTTDYVEIRSNEFGWGPGVKMTQDQTNKNIFYYESIINLQAGENISDYKFWYSCPSIDPNGIWEDDPNWTYKVTQQDLDNGKIVIHRNFSDLTLDKVTNVSSNILMTIDTNGGHDRSGNSLPNPIRTMHITGSRYPLSWSGWYLNTTDYMKPMYDDGTHGDAVALDGIYSNTFTFPAYTPFELQYTYVINFVQSGFIPYECQMYDNHILDLEQNLISAKAYNVYGIMSSVTGITPLTDKIYTVKYENNSAQTSLTSLASSTTGETQNIVTDALNSFTDSQDPKYWVDDSHLSDQGQKVFEDTKQSVEDLMKLGTDVDGATQTMKSAGPNVLNIITHIYNADRNLVTSYLNESKTKYTQKGCGNNPQTNNCKKIKKRLDDSDQSVAQAKSKFDKGEYSKSIEELKKGWQSLRDITKEKLFKSGEMDNSEIIPSEFSLAQNYPNPFNPTTQIQFGLPIDSKVSLKVYDILGREVAELANGVYDAGIHTYLFDGSKLSSGVYVYQINANGNDGRSFSQTKKLILMK